MDAIKNFAYGVVSTGYDDDDTSIVLTAGYVSKLAAVPFNLVWWNFTDYPSAFDDPKVEIVRVTGISTNTLTVTRGQEGIAASTKNTAGKTYLMMQSATKGLLDQISGIAINSQSAAYTTVLSDAGKKIVHPASDNNARTFTIDSNANVPYSVDGPPITIINLINTITIAQTSDTLIMAGTGLTGSRTLAANGIATINFLTTTTKFISGIGLS